MFVIPHLVKAIRRVLKRSATPEAVPVVLVPATKPEGPSLRLVPRTGPVGTSLKSDELPGMKSAGECLNELMRDLRRRRDLPLVRVDEEPSDSNGYAIGFVFADRAHGGFEYDFYCRSPLEALSWIRQTAGKSWVTTEHLELFADLAIARFDDKPRKAA